MRRHPSPTQRHGVVCARHVAIRRRRWPLVVVMALAAVSAVVWAGVVLSPLPGRGDAATSTGADVPTTHGVDEPLRRQVDAPPTRHGDRWRSVLQRLSAQRARAWRDGDPAALGAVYAHGSDVLARDRRSLRAYAARGFMVRGAQLRFGAITPVQRGHGVVRLRVVDRLERSSVVASTGVERNLPRDNPSRHWLRLEKWDGRWLIAAIWPT